MQITSANQIPGYSLIVLPASYSYGRPSDSEYDCRRHHFLLVQVVHQFFYIKLIQKASIMFLNYILDFGKDLVSRSQTAFTRRERVWYNAYTRLVQSPPEEGGDNCIPHLASPGNRPPTDYRCCVNNRPKPIGGA